MSEPSSAELLRQAAVERDLLRVALAGRLTAANVAAVSYGMAALLGELATATARPGMLNIHLDNLADTMRANAALRLDRTANVEARGNA